MVAESKVAYHASLSDEWYTPKEIVDSARATMGGIDLDPASCASANAIVGATHYYNEKVDGLSPDLQWIGRVWMNPPYSKKAQMFMSKLLSERLSGRVTEAIALFNANAMTSKWFQPAYCETDALLVTFGRLRFAPGDPNQPFSSPSTGSVILYMGDNSGSFARAF